MNLRQLIHRAGQARKAALHHVRPVGRAQPVCRGHAALPAVGLHTARGVGGDAGSNHCEPGGKRPGRRAGARCCQAVCKPGGEVFDIE